MQWIKTSLISGILMLCSWTTGLCADPPDKKVTALYTEDEIVVDGILDETTGVWLSPLPILFRTIP